MKSKKQIFWDKQLLDCAKNNYKKGFTEGQRKAREEIIKMIDERIIQLQFIEAELRRNHLNISHLELRQNLCEVEWGRQEYEELKQKILEVGK